MIKTIIRYINIFFLLNVVNAHAQEPLLYCYGVNNGKIELNWDLPTNTCGGIQSIEVYGSTNIDGSSRVLLANLTGSETQMLAEVTFRSFQVEFITNCTGNNRVLSNILSRQEEKLNITFTGINLNGDIEIEWEPLRGGVSNVEYILQGFDNVDIFTGIRSTTAIIPESSWRGNGLYQLLANDGCDNKTPPAVFNYIELNAEEPNICDNIIKLVWNQNLLYPGAEYIIETNTGAGWTELAKTLDTEYVMSYGNQTDMSIRIKIDQGARPSYSVTLDLSNLPIFETQQELQIERIFFDDRNDLFAQWYSDTLAPINTVMLMGVQDGQSVPSAALGGQSVVQDVTPLRSTNAEINIVSTDQCGNDFTGVEVAIPYLSFTLQTGEIVLETIDFLSDEHQIVSYDWFGNNSLISSTNDATFTTPYSIEERSIFKVHINAIIVVDGVEKNVVFVSNLVSTEVRNSVEIPNAFSPRVESENGFRPYFNTTELVKYNFQIFDRWGNKLFETDQVSDGWKPEIGILSTQVLIFKINIEFNEGKRYSEIGTFTYFD